MWELKISEVWIIYIIKMGGSGISLVFWTVGKGNVRVVIRSKGGFRSPVWEVLRGGG